MTKEELDFIGSMNMCDEISNEAYKKIVNHVEETEISDDCVSLEVYKQVTRERDIAIEQLKELGYEFGEKIRTSDDCVSRAELMKLYYESRPTLATHVYEFGEKLQALPPVIPTQSKWHLVKDELPRKFSFVNCTCHSLIDDREDWVIETCYIPQYPNSPYSDWCNIPMLNNGECEVIAWMYRDIPKPYKEK